MMLHLYHSMKTSFYNYFHRLNSTYGVLFLLILLMNVWLTDVSFLFVFTGLVCGLLIAVHRSLGLFLLMLAGFFQIWISEDILLGSVLGIFSKGQLVMSLVLSTVMSLLIVVVINAIPFFKKNPVISATTITFSIFYFMISQVHLKSEFLYLTGVVLLSKYIYICLMAKAEQPFKNKLMSIIFLQPFFRTGLPLFLSPQNFEDSLTDFSKQDYKNSVINALKVTLAILINSLCGYFLNAQKGNTHFLSLMIPKVDLINPWSGSAQIASVYSTFPKNYLLAFLVLTFHLSLMYYALGLSALVLNLMGFKTEMNFQKPLDSKTFSQFLSRTMHFYKKILIYLFFLPIHRIFSKLNITEKRPLSICIAVFFGGLAIHFPISMVLQPLQPFEVMLENFLSFMPYFLLLATLSMMSNAVEEHLDYSKQNILQKSLRIFFYFTIYACIALLGLGLQRSGIYIENWRLFLSLFGL